MSLTIATDNQRTLSIHDHRESPLHQWPTLLTLPMLVLPGVGSNGGASIFPMPGLVLGLSICAAVFRAVHQISTSGYPPGHTSLPPEVRFSHVTSGSLLQLRTQSEADLEESAP